jgi:hypothetical protein
MIRDWIIRVKRKFWTNIITRLYLSEYDTVEGKSDYGKIRLQYTVEFHAALIKTMRLRVKSTATNSLEWIKTQVRLHL